MTCFSRHDSAFSRVKLSCAAVAASVVLLGCSSTFTDGTPVTEQTTDPLTTVIESGTIRIGISTDVPGLGAVNPETGHAEGFEPDLGRMVAAELGIAEDQIQWVETISANREAFLANGTVDIVIEAYSMSGIRQSTVGQAGPYLETVQSLMVADSEDKITGFESLGESVVCAGAGTRSYDRLTAFGRIGLVTFNTVAECINQLNFEAVDAVSADDLILRGYASELDSVQIVGTMGSEHYGMGYPIESERWCPAINNWLQQWFEDGTWSDLYQQWFGDPVADIPELQPCQ